MNADQDRRDPHDPGGPEEADSTQASVARGRSPATPFVLLGGVATLVWLAVAVVSLAVLLTWWLV